ncbi:MAG: glycosyl hydrolase family 28 protein [Planctomycetota bacterium]|nr:glycosyl hydrolase family 28 protein [Planctomycetota bacterium]
MKSHHVATLTRKPDKYVPSLPRLAAILAALVIIFGSACAAAATAENRVIVYPAPAGEPLSTDYKVSVAGKDVPVYAAKVAPADDKRRWKAMDDKKNSADYFDTAAFAYFDIQGPVTVTVTVPQAVTAAKILPASAGITPTFREKSVTFTVASPRNLVVEINGEWIRSLHLFANPIETDVPRADDPNVIYFAPGVHKISRMAVGDGKTVYIAGGAVVRAVIDPDEKFRVSGDTGLRSYPPTFELKGQHITFRGRGILDSSACPTHARSPVFVIGSDITVEGVILRDSALWTIPIRRSDRVTVRNVKLLGYRANSDGIDICNSRDVTVENCFIRTLDDLIVVKSDKGQGEVKRITARGCVLWNQVAHALSVGAELRENVDDVLFTDCDLIHDQGREWALRVYHCDAARVSNIRFESIRIEEARRCISVWIGKAVWSRDPERGHIQGVTFKNIRAAGAPLTVQLTGGDESHPVEDVSFQDVVLSGKPLARDAVQTNAFVKNLSVRP